MSISSIRDVALEGQRVFARFDLNVPLDGDVITSDARIRAALPTLRHCLDAGASVVVSSHLGRPKGKRAPEFSLEPVGLRLSELLGMDVLLTENCVGETMRMLVKDLKPGQVMLLENLRFHAGETGNDPAFIRELARPFDLENDVYVNDAFGACHRAHASIVGVSSRFAHRAMGFLLEKELTALGRLLRKPATPFVAVVGGAKVADKLGILTSLLGRVDALCIGGAMAYTFLKAQGRSVGASRWEENQLTTARDFLDRAQKRGVQVVLPADHVVGEAFEESTPARILPEADIPEGMMGLDIGPKTRSAMTDVVSTAQTLFWNGPMGVFEWSSFRAGTFAVAEAVAGCSGFTVVGGGDSVAAAEQAGVVARLDHVSTGGGASLELLQHETLPGLDALAGKRMD